MNFRSINARVESRLRKPAQALMRQKILRPDIDRADKSLGRKSIAMSPSSEAPIRSNTTWPNPLRARRFDRRAAALLPGELHAVRCRRASQPIATEPAGARQRAMLGRVGGKLVHDQAERLHRLRPQIHLRSAAPRTCRHRSRRTARAGPAAVPPASRPASRAEPEGRANRRAPGCSRAARFSKSSMSSERRAIMCVSPCTTASRFLVRCDSSRSVKARCSLYSRFSVMSRCTAATPATRCRRHRRSARR